jgi:tRNA dimethylallyltransferase
MSLSLRPIVLLGPTASGKTELAEGLARFVPLRLISADSMQAYRGMDIGTSKPGPASRGLWSLLDLADPGQLFSVGDWLRAANAELGQAQAQGQRPLICGGTGLYLSALAEGLAEIPAINPALRAGLERRLELEGLAALAQELKDQDPELAQGLDLKNPRRVLRGLEVLQATGEPLSRWQARPRRGGLGVANILWLGLDPGIAGLEERIARRTQAMLRQGWLAECQSLRQGVGEAQVRATGAIGYAEVFDVLDGRLQARRAEAEIQSQTRQYAKRQRTWFKRMPGILWLDPERAGQQASERIQADKNPA